MKTRSVLALLAVGSLGFAAGYVAGVLRVGR